MAKVLRCPECGAGAEDMQVTRTALVVYQVAEDPTDPDGIRLFNDQVETTKDWEILCHLCGYSSDSEDFTAAFLVELDSVSGENA